MTLSLDDTDIRLAEIPGRKEISSPSDEIHFSGRRSHDHVGKRSRTEEGDLAGDKRAFEPEIDHRETEVAAAPPPQYAGMRLHILSTGFSIATFMVALDRTILATAIPKITTEFNSLSDIGWYGSAYLLTQMSMQPTMGRVYVYFEAKTTYLLSVLVFEVGSIICASAPNSAVLILGRAVAGVGSAGMVSGSLAVYGQVVPLRQRPMGMAIVNSTYALAGLLGPTLGGVFTDTPRLTWRFCFWINLPFGAISAATVMYILRTKKGIHADLPITEKLIRLDPLGAMLLTSSLVCLFLALQWGGTELPWSNSRVWGCLVGFALLAILFFALQVVRKEKATIPLRILNQRTVIVSCAFSCLYSVAVITHSYLLPIYFQAVKGTSATLSGVYGIPFTIASAIATIVTGFSMTAYGYYVPLMWVGSLVYLAGSVVYYLLQAQSGPGKWVVCQILAGIGFGLSIQIGFIAVQVVSLPEDMPTACAWEIFFKAFGGAVGISMAQTIFTEKLVVLLNQIPGLDTTAVINAGAADISAAKNAIPAAFVEPVKLAYNGAIRAAFLLPVAATALAALVTLGMEWKKIEDEASPLLEATHRDESGDPATNPRGGDPK
ncbi:hypothetical protein BP5796_10764 [Coleophoma crateriformis]|uniref:Major facilitator superfamily (MFS) profile domain-containing protein n=1 Tax=Coleophoma crateriformis TaxID=565419 RepID=A0A3D8QR37_9HELO|nr:hypothetical protein BP5796_10764 [Coleophoma crateriformis]